VNPYEGDLETYRAMLLEGTRPIKSGAKPKPAKPKRPSRDIVLELRKDVRKCEERVEKLNQMRDKIAAILANTALYGDMHGTDAANWQKKYSEVMNGLDRAETLWMASLERLERAENP
jgi:ATP-binding cassette subfamily F protein 3